MNDDPNKNTPSPSPANVPARKPLSPQAKRAIAEAEERRAEAAKHEATRGPKELQGPEGPEPTRFGDWERKGIASDF